MPNYRQPTEKEAKKLEGARKKTVEGIEEIGRAHV